MIECDTAIKLRRKEAELARRYNDIEDLEARISQLWDHRAALMITLKCVTSATDPSLLMPTVSYVMVQIRSEGEVNALDANDSILGYDREGIENV